VAIISSCRYLSFRREIFPGGFVEPTARRTDESTEAREIPQLFGVAAVCLVVAVAGLWLIERWTRHAGWFALQPRGFRAVVLIGSLFVGLVIPHGLLGYFRCFKSGTSDARLHLQNEIGRCLGAELRMIGQRRADARRRKKSKASGASLG
jgi:hypothetical protein